MNKYLAEYLDMHCVVFVLNFAIPSSFKQWELKRLESTNCISRTLSSNIFITVQKHMHTQYSVGINHLCSNLKPNIACTGKS